MLEGSIMIRKIDIFRLLTIVSVEDLEINAANFLESLEFQSNGLILSGIINSLEEMLGIKFEILPSFLGNSAIENGYSFEYDEMKNFTIAKIKLEEQTADEISEKAWSLPDAIYLKEIVLCGECDGSEIAFCIN
jgi:hypothetical protein